MFDGWGKMSAIHACGTRLWCLGKLYTWCGLCKKHADRRQLGNNRGNKYSKKSTNLSPTSNEFWNFSVDQFAFHDIPDSINYILATTYQPSLSYVGFSQGTAQAFATLSIHPNLNDRVDVFIALAPAMSPAGLHNSVVDALMKASPEVIFLAFGRRSILSSAIMWQSILYPPIFVRIIDMFLIFLFNWTGKNISPYQKLAAYPHLYSFTSTKSVVHWFQIIRNKSFQMFDDDVNAPLSIGASDRYYKVAKFPTRNIKTPIVLLFGGSDSLVDINVMLRELPRHTIVKEVPHFEHLDFLWGQEVDTLVFPHIFDALKKYSGRNYLKSGYSFKSVGNPQLANVRPRTNSEDENSPKTPQDESDLSSGAYGSLDEQRKIESRKGSSRLAREYRSQASTLLSDSPGGVGRHRPAGKEILPGLETNYAESKHWRSDSLSSEGTRKISQRGISIGASKAIVGGINSPGVLRVADLDHSGTSKGLQK